MSLQLERSIRIGPYYGLIIPHRDMPRGQLHYQDKPATHKLHGCVPKYTDPVNIGFSRGNGKFIAWICMYCKFFDTVEEVEEFFDTMGAVDWRPIPAQNWMTPLQPCLAEIRRKYAPPVESVYHIPHRHDYIG